MSKFRKLLDFFLLPGMINYTFLFILFDWKITNEKRGSCNKF